MNAVATPQPYEVPEGGLASFLTATVGDWSDEALNSDTYYDIVKPTAEQLAEFGRVGDDGRKDDRIAHVATGETVIPLAVFEENPGLKESLFRRMREMGLEPEQYVVGNELNSINPVTGQPEFIFKSIFKGIKKAVKGVVKVFKKIAPIVLSTVGFMVAGPLGASLGSGIGTLVQGGNLKDAFKSALISGVTAGVGQGIAKGFSAASAGSATGLGNIGEFASGFGQSITSIPTQFMNPDFGVLTNLLPDPKLPAQETVTPAGSAAPSATGSAADKVRAAQLAKGPAANPEVLAKAGAPTLSTAPANLDPFAPSDTPALDPVQELADAMQTGTGGTTAGAGTSELQSLIDSAKDPRTFLEKIRDGDFLEAFKGQRGVTKDQILDTLLRAEGQTLATAPEALLTELSRRTDLIFEGLAQPSLLAKYGPMALGGLALTGAMGGFKPGAPPEPFDFFAGMDRTPYQFAFPGSQFRAAAGGGEMTNFPRKNGAIYGPGTETSDDIPAMLSDGEFVMTARAVRGAGNGSRQDGMKRMYDMMRTFEGRAARG